MNTKELNKQIDDFLEREFMNPNFDSNGDLFLQMKYNDDNSNSTSVLKSFICNTVSQALSHRDSEILGMLEQAINDNKIGVDFAKINGDKWRESVFYSIIQALSDLSARIKGE